MATAYTPRHGKSMSHAMATTLMPCQHPPCHLMPTTSEPCDAGNPWRQPIRHVIATTSMPWRQPPSHAMVTVSMPCHGDSLYVTSWQQHKQCHGNNLRAMRCRQPHSHGDSLLLLNIIDYSWASLDLFVITSPSHPRRCHRRS